MKIFVGNLPFSIEESELSSSFEKIGEVSSVAILTDKFTGRSRGFGFIEMPDEQKAKIAIEALNGSELGGRAIQVKEALERTENTRSQNFGPDKRKGGGFGNNRNTYSRKY